MSRRTQKSRMKSYSRVLFFPHCAFFTSLLARLNDEHILMMSRWLVLKLSRQFGRWCWCFVQLQHWIYQQMCFCCQDLHHFYLQSLLIWGFPTFTRIHLRFLFYFGRYILMCLVALSTSSLCLFCVSSFSHCFFSLYLFVVLLNSASFIFFIFFVLLSAILFLALLTFGICVVGLWTSKEKWKKREEVRKDSSLWYTGLKHLLTKKASEFKWST